MSDTALADGRDAGPNPEKPGAQRIKLAENQPNQEAPMPTPNPHPAADERHEPWQAGYDEAADDIGRTYDSDPESPRSVAYDEGRNAGEADAAS